MSIHTDRAFSKAQFLGASAARDRSTWAQLMAMSKRELAEIAMHLGALCTDSYDDALNSDGALERVLEEHSNLKANRII